MDKQYASLLAVIFIVSSLFYACDDKKDKKTGALEFDKILLNESAHLFGDTAKPACKLMIDYKYVVKSSNEQLKDSINMLLTTATLGDKYMADEPNEAIKNYAETYISEYLHDLEPMYLEDRKDKENAASISSWYSYYRAIETDIKFYERDLLVYYISYNEYTGGAHGMYMTNFLNIDLKNMHQIVLDDLFIENYSEALTDLLWNQLMMDNKVTTRDELEDLGYGLTGDLGPTENFYLNKDGITFHYNVYEFTPYVMGATEIRLPFSMVSHLLKSHPIISQLK